MMTRGLQRTLLTLSDPNDSAAYWIRQACADYAGHFTIDIGR